MNMIFASGREGIVVALAICTGGCATVHRFEVDAVKSEYVNVPGKAFCVVNGNPELGSDDLRFQQAREYVVTALSGRGMFEVDDTSQADLLVEVDFGQVGPIQRVELLEVPVWVSGDAINGILADPETKPGPRPRAVTLARMTATETGSGYDTHVTIITEYERFLRLSAREAQPDPDGPGPREVWSVVVENTSGHGDLDADLPLLVAAALDAVESDTGGIVEVDLKESDERIAFVRRGL